MKTLYTHSRYTTHWMTMDLESPRWKGVHMVVFDRNQEHLLQALLIVYGVEAYVRIDDDQPIAMNEVIVKVVE
jgi:hypothetical protein